MKWDFITNNLVIKILSLLIAFILWFLITAKKPAEQEFPVSLHFANVPSGLSIARPLPSEINVRLSGPGLILQKLEKQKMAIKLDMQNLKEGPVTFYNLGRNLAIPVGLSLTRISPSSVDLKLVQNVRLPVRKP